MSLPGIGGGYGRGQASRLIFEVSDLKLATFRVGLAPSLTLPRVTGEGMIFSPDRDQLPR